MLSALQEAGLDGSSVACIQRKASGEILLTFRKADLKERFVRSSVLKVNGAPYAIQDVDRPLTFVQIFDAPHELPDSAIIQRLADYCEVVTYRRGFFRDPGWENVQDGSRHYRVRMKKPIPSYMRFGKQFIQFRYVGQPKTCRLCHSASHFANACHTIICFNCEKTGHLASDCPAPIACNICKATTHLARKCPFSWTTISEIPPVNDADNTPPVPSTNTPSDNNDSLEISPLSVGPATANQLDQMESDNTITPKIHRPTKNFLLPLKTKTTTKISRIQPNFLNRVLTTFRLLRRLTPLYLMDANPLSTSTAQHRQGSLHNLKLLLAKDANFLTNRTKTLLLLNAIVLEIGQTNTRNIAPRNLNGLGMFCLL